MFRYILSLATILLLVGCSTEETSNDDDENTTNEEIEASIDQESSERAPIQESDVAIVNDNIPYFSDEDLTFTEAFHENGSLDPLGRTTAANANVGVEIMPAEERGSISDINPTGWEQARYAGIPSGGWLYNRSHLIGHQMTGNDEPENLMTGTRNFNMAMLEYENYVANYVEQSEKHVRYRVTPAYEGDNLLASGVYMEAFSIEDNGEGVQFHIYVPNVQPGVEIDYSTGASIGPEGPAEDGDVKAYSPPSEDSSIEPETSNNISEIDTDANGQVTIQEAEDAGYGMPIQSDHWLYEHMYDSDSDGVIGE